MVYVKREWGWEHRDLKGHQFGASVGREIEHLLGRALTKQEARVLRRCGAVRIDVVGAR